MKAHTFDASIVEDIYGIPQVRISVGSDIHRSVTLLSVADLPAVVAALAELSAQHHVAVSKTLHGGLAENSWRKKIMLADSRALDDSA